MREVAARRADGGRENGIEFLSPSQPVRLTAPSSEGALGGHHLYTHVLVNDPTTGYGIFIENMLDAAA
ncbi:MAG: hypothetical protein E7437_02885 [Ruminococcaceae bacterium]|nr:hypothetical protein [Oscillospiraceae bacterium]